MLRRLDAVEQRGQEQRAVEARIAAAAAAPGAELAVAARGDDRRPDRAQPSACASSRRRDHPGGGIAPATRCATATASASVATTGSSCAASAAAVAGSAPPWTRTASVRVGDPRRHLELDVERGAADLLEPEPVLLDEVEREPVGARRARRRHGELELDPLPGGDGVGQRRSGPVPDDRVAERVEPVEGGLDAVRAVRAPGRRARVLERDARRRGDAGPRRRRATTRASGARAALP